jgi:hypothetical protein
MYCVFLGKAVQTVNPPNGSVGISQLSATGTKDSTTFLRGDNTFASAGGDNTPAFMAESDVGQGTSNAADALIQYNLERYDTDGAYDNTSGNYKFTVPSGKAGKYFFSASLNAYNVSVNNSIWEINIKLFKNGAKIGDENLRPGTGSTFHAGSLAISRILDLNVGDYIQVYGNIWVSSGTATLTNDTGRMQFQGFKLIGV